MSSYCYTQRFIYYSIYLYIYISIYFVHLSHSFISHLSLNTPTYLSTSLPHSKTQYTDESHKIHPYINYQPSAINHPNNQTIIIIIIIIIIQHSPHPQHLETSYQTTLLTNFTCQEQDSQWMKFIPEQEKGKK